MQKKNTRTRIKTFSSFKYFILILFVNTCFSQNVFLEGKITDDLNKPLEFANIFAYPENNASVVYAISDDLGRYKLVLEKNENYKITVSYLGFEPLSFDLKLKSSRNKNIVLVENSEKLKEVTINYTPPVVVKKDTITYRTDAFTTGEERKLRDILKKLPAVEVDRNGNVTVQGKKVTKVLVEDKEFFTADSKLAVNNIPADAVEKIQVLDNYNEVSFLKNLEDSEDVAMNIKLKKDKKEFIFGDIETGGGFKKRYLIHPSLYYYSPKKSINFIGDFNNTGTRSFTIKDYIDFEGGKNKIINDAKGYFSLQNDDIAQFINGRDFTESENLFGAINLNQTVNEHTELSAYGILSDVKNETKLITINDYISNDNLIENRTENGNQKNTFGVTKIQLRNKRNDHTDFKVSSYIKTSKNKFNNNISTITEERSNIIDTDINIENISYKQNVKWHKQFNKNNTTSAILSYQYQKATPNTNWLTDQSILEGLIPIVDEDSYNIFKTKETKSHNLDINLKHYWVINRFNHIYFTLGYQLAFDDYKTSDFQILDDGSINDFSFSNFGNNVNFNFNETYFGVHYKFQKGKFILKPGVFYHTYNWNITQFDNRSTNNKIILLPEFNSDIEFSQTKKLNLKYNLKVRFPNISQLANRFNLIDFNSIYQGNQNLENELYHHTQLRFYSFNLFKDLFYNFSASYRFKEDNFKNTTTIQGIDIISSPILSNFENNYLYFNGSIRKGFGDYKFSLKSSIAKANYENPINSEIIKNSSSNYSLGGTIETRFNDFPNIEINYTKSINNFKGLSNSKFQSDVFSIFLEYDFLQDFIFKLDYRFENYNNKSFDITNTFDIANSSMFYQKENSPWGFEISATNIFNVAFRQRNSFSSILVSDKRTFILPRIGMLKVSYKL